MLKELPLYGKPDGSTLFTLEVWHFDIPTALVSAGLMIIAGKQEEKAGEDGAY